MLKQAVAGVRKFPTAAELQLRERENLAIVLARAQGKVNGPGGADELVGASPPL